LRLLRQSDDSFATRRTMLPASVEPTREARRGIRARTVAAGGHYHGRRRGEAPPAPIGLRRQRRLERSISLREPHNCEAELGKAGASHEGSPSLVGRRVPLRGVASGVRAFDFGKTMESPGSDARAIVVQRPVCVRRIARVGRRSLRTRRIVSSRNNWRMLEQARRISVFRGERGSRRERG
jgi:hypothetical protein